jgi:hypothetical protein
MNTWLAGYGQTIKSARMREKMKKAIPVAAVLLVSFSYMTPEISKAPALSPEKESTAFIGDFSGQVTLIQSEGSSLKEVSIGQTLYEGDQVRLAFGARVTICYLDGREPIRCSGIAIVPIGPSQPSSAQTAKTRVLFQNIRDFLAGRQKVRLTTELSLRGSSLENTEIIPLTPVGTKIWGNLKEILFAWEDSPLFPVRDKTSGYTFRLFDAGQAEIFKKSGLKEKRFLCPLDSPQLKLKKDVPYYWSVCREQMPISLFSFRIVPPEKDDALAGQISEWEKQRLGFPVDELVLFQLYEDNGYYYDSYLLLEKTLKKSPENQLFNCLLEQYYASHFPEYADVLQKSRSPQRLP